MADTTDLQMKESGVSGVIEISLEDPQVLIMMRALSSKTRWKILKNLKHRLDVCQTAKKLKQTEANISAQIKILEKEFPESLQVHHLPGGCLPEGIG